MASYMQEIRRRLFRRGLSAWEGKASCKAREDLMLDGGLESYIRFKCDDLVVESPNRFLG